VRATACCAWLHCPVLGLHELGVTVCVLALSGAFVLPLLCRAAALGCCLLFVLRVRAPAAHAVLSATCPPFFPCPPPFIPCRSRDGLAAALGPEFELVSETELPCALRSCERMYSVSLMGCLALAGVSLSSGWFRSSWSCAVCRLSLMRTSPPSTCHCRCPSSTAACGAAWPRAPRLLGRAAFLTMAAMMPLLNPKA